MQQPGGHQEHDRRDDLGDHQRRSQTFLLPPPDRAPSRRPSRSELGSAAEDRREAESRRPSARSARPQRGGLERRPTATRQSATPSARAREQRHGRSREEDPQRAAGEREQQALGHAAVAPDARARRRWPRAPRARAAARARARAAGSPGWRRRSAARRRPRRRARRAAAASARRLSVSSCDDRRRSCPCSPWGTAARTARQSPPSRRSPASSVTPGRSRPTASSQLLVRSIVGVGAFAESHRLPEQPRRCAGSGSRAA